MSNAKITSGNIAGAFTSNKGAGAKLPASIKPAGKANKPAASTANMPKVYIDKRK